MTRKLEFIMDVKEVRRLNLEYLIASVGSIKKIAEIIESDANYISQIKNGNGNKTMGDKFARKIEKAFNKPHGWMDKLQFMESKDYSTLNDEELLTVAVKTVINQLVAAGIYLPQKSIDSAAVSSLIVSEYKQLICDKKSTPGAQNDSYQAG